MAEPTFGQHAAVKRARSNSVESAASSSTSNKRSSPSVALANMDLSSDAIASSRTERESGGSDSSSSNATEPLMATEMERDPGQLPTAELPPGETQLAMVLPEMRQTFRVGDRWFVIDRVWYRKWQAACGSPGDDKDLANISLREVGPIDNSSIASTTSGKLIKAVVEGDNVVFVPGPVWHMLERWCVLQNMYHCDLLIGLVVRYGRTGVPVEREVYTTKEGPSLDLDPPEVTVSRVIHSSSPQQPSDAITIQAASSWTIANLKLRIAQAMNLDIESASRLWHIAEEYTAGTITPDHLSQAELESAGDGDILRLSTIRNHSHLAFEQANADGTWLTDVNVNGSGVHTAVPASTSSKALFAGPGFYDKMQGTHDQIVKKRAELTSASVAMSSNASRNSATSNTARQARDKRRGLVGLQNLGNTCFVSSFAKIGIRPR